VKKRQEVEEARWHTIIKRLKIKHMTTLTKIAAEASRETPETAEQAQSVVDNNNNDGERIRCRSVVAYYIQDTPRGGLCRAAKGKITI